MQQETNVIDRADRRRISGGEHDSVTIATDRQQLIALGEVDR